MANATFYRLLENPDGVSGFTQVGSDIPQGTLSFDHVVPLYQRINASYTLESCNSVGCTDVAPLFVSGPFPVTVSASLVDAVGFFKASNTGELDRFGQSLALNGDGTTLAVGAPGKASLATGIDGDQTDTSGIPFDPGAVYLY